MKTYPDRLSPEQYRELASNKAAKKKPVARWGKTGPTESQQQTECVNWFRDNYPQYELLLYAVPNGGHRSKRTAATLQREGVVSGIPDQVLAVPKNGYHGLYIEQKIKGNKPSPNQLKAMAALAEQGYKTEVVYSIEQFQEVITNYLNAA